MITKSDIVVVSGVVTLQSPSIHHSHCFFVFKDIGDALDVYCYQTERERQRQENGDGETCNDMSKVGEKIFCIQNDLNPRMFRLTTLDMNAD